MKKNLMDASSFLNHLTRIGSALSSNGGPLAVHGEVASVFQEQIGYLLYTVSMVEPVHGQTTTRVWSSDTTAYPIGETKMMESGKWAAEVAQRQPVVCNQPGDIQGMFPSDFELLTRLGCGSGVNLPVFLCGALIGSINVFNKTGWFTPQRVAHCQSLATLVYAPLLLCKERK